MRGTFILVKEIEVENIVWLLVKISGVSAENLCFTAYEKFVAKYGLIENVTAYKDEKTGKLVKRGYFTNSMHVPVWKKISPFQKIDIESKLTGFSSAGCITYVDLDENARHNVKAVQQIVDYAMSKDIPYFAINVPIDTCMQCGYQSKRIRRRKRCSGKCN